MQCSKSAVTDYVLLGQRLERIGTLILRYGLVLILFLVGSEKWTKVEAEAIQPWVSHSPVMSWIYSFASVQTGSELIGFAEISIAILIASRRWLPRLALIGSIGAALMFLTTLSFLVTTPGQSADAQGFLIKDVFLFGASIWSAGEALRALSPELPSSDF